MSDEDFLSRWSRRKRDIAEAEKPASAETHGVGIGESPESNGEVKPAEPEFDISTLPPIESITSATDIAAFMRAGVPEALKHAVLRRAWAADPAIRDFIEIAENQWDFTAAFGAGGPPGFGALDPAQHNVAKMVEDVFGHAKQAVDKAGEAATQAASGPVAEPASTAPLPDSAARPMTDTRQQIASGDLSAEKVAHEPDDADDLPPPKTHGGALPG